METEGNSVFFLHIELKRGEESFVTPWHCDEFHLAVLCDM